MRDIRATAGAWWGNLETREKTLIASATVLLLISVGYFMIWQPYAERQELLAADIEATQQLLLRLNSVAPGQRIGKPITGLDQSLLSILDKTGKTAGLGDSIKRIQPDGEQTARLWMEGADFTKLLRWLKQLQERYGIEVSDAVINREESAGLVRARISFQRLG